MQIRPSAVLIYSIIFTPMLAGCSDQPRATPQAANPMGLVDQFGKPEPRPLNIGDVTTTAADTTRRSSEQVAHLWLDLKDRDRNRWIDGEGFGEGDKFDRYMKKLAASGRILHISQGVRVRVLELYPPPDRKYVFTYFRCEVQDGVHAGRVGWLSYFGLKHKS